MILLCGGASTLYLINESPLRNSMMLQAIHTAVPGRARFRVQGLNGANGFKGRLEEQIRQHAKIKSVSASSITGTVLVHFDAGTDFATVEECLKNAFEACKNEAREFDNPSRTNVAAAAGRTKNSIQGQLARSKVSKKVKTTLKHLSHSHEDQTVQAWHTCSPQEVLSLLGSNNDVGLPAAMADERLKRYGLNMLPESSTRSKWSVFAGQFMSLPVALLGAAAGISIVTGGLIDAVVIMGVVVGNAVIGFVTESESERTIQSLKRVVHPVARVKRDGEVKKIPVEEIAVGDLVILRSGDYVPADARVIEAKQLTIDESALTGESLPVVKDSRPLQLKNAPLAERSNMVYMGTLVIGGQGLAVVVATGRFSEMGQIQTLLQETSTPETPIERQLSEIGDHLVLFSGAICGLVFAMGLVRGLGLVYMIRSAVALAAAAVPEGLPAAATTTFALAVRGMKEHHVLIRHLQAAETLGAVQVVCFDKTGTITRNKMTVLTICSGHCDIKVSGNNFNHGGKSLTPMEDSTLLLLLQVATLCNETEIDEDEDQDMGYRLRGSPTEKAILEVALRAGVDVIKLRNEHPILKTNYRAENRLFMSTLHAAPDGEKLLAVKGSPSALLELCSHWHCDGDKLPLTENDRRVIQMENERMAGKALRVLGVACANREDDGPEGDLVWLGLIGMADPVREGVKELIEVFHRAGIETVMITGDQSPTAYAVAQHLDLSAGKPMVIMDSSELDALGHEMLEALASKAHAYSRVSPSHKLKIVEALQMAGRVVAMTGDGINDGPALKAADIGIAMGHSGTDVAREVADVVLERDNLETLVIALADGRTIHHNIKKSVHFFLSTNFSEIMVMAAAMAVGLGTPLSAMQLLWINIVSDIFPGLALSLEAPEPDVLEQPPRDPQAPLFSIRDYKRMSVESAVISAAALGSYAFGLLRYGPGVQAGGLAFQSLTLGQLLHAISCRSERNSIYDREKLPPNPYLKIALGGTLVLQGLTMIVPGLRSFLGLGPFSLVDTAVIGATSVASLMINESTKTRWHGVEE